MKQDLFKPNLAYRNFTIKDLEDLIDLKNHKAVCVGKDTYVWSRLECGVWVTLHDIEKTSIRQIYNYIQFNIAMWSLELSNRISMDSKSAFYKDAKKSKLMYNVSESKLTTKEKIREILNSYPETSAKQLANTLYIDIKSVYKHLKALGTDNVRQYKVTNVAIEEDLGYDMLDHNDNDFY